MDNTKCWNIKSYGPFLLVPTRLYFTQFRSFSITTEYHLNVGEVILARRPQSPVTSFEWDTTIEDLEAMVYPLLGLWLFVWLKVIDDDHRNDKNHTVTVVTVTVLNMAGFLWRTHDSFSDVALWPISGLRSVDVTFAWNPGRLGAKIVPGTKS